MVVNATMGVEVDVQPKSAIEILKDYLGLSNLGSYTSIVLLDENHSENHCGKKAIYKIDEKSWYGAYRNEYRLLTSDEKEIAIFEAIQLLEKIVDNNEKLF